MLIKTETIQQQPGLDRGIPKWVFLQLLESCNLRCKMCFEWGDNGAYKEKPELKKLDLAVVKKIIEDCSPARPYYELYGGEPLIYPWIDEVLESIKYHHSSVHFPTNGTLLERHAEMLVEHAPERVWVSLDGPEEINDAQRGEGVFQKAMKGIRKLYEVRESKGSIYPKIGISTAVTPINHQHLERFYFQSLDMSMIDCISVELQQYVTQERYEHYATVLKEQFDVPSAPIARGFISSPAHFSSIDAKDLARQLKLIEKFCKDSGRYFNAYPKVISEDNIRHYFNAKWEQVTNMKKRCVFPWISTEINARGGVTSCHNFYDLTLGNVNEQGLLDIWNGPKYKEYREYLKKQLFSICPGCCLYYNEKPSH
ncbi:radical SAM protein [Paenibacillus sp. FSL H7-0331]|uniref:radical SAM protein n=1 Tax=Paenibacillus sp. FSL H7-0331 TaxID=1920421 RepID=UPI00096BF820|nr:radical SAM protein [Paenibacillus sp. FSL H7-0331]OMF20045.1 radical SAM protein [Paenibacillus sp. FSL H7-0331]